MAPKIETDEQALARVHDHLLNSSTHTWRTEIVGYQSTRFLVGVTYSDGRKEVIIVGPRGGLDRWISADAEFATHLAEFMLRS